MSEKFQNKYRTETTRLKNWDYSLPGTYFVTICTQKGKYYFGDIKNEQMQYTETGKIAKQYFNEIPKHYPNVVINEFVVMPNHVHGLVIITNNSNNKIRNVEATFNVETQNFASLQQRKNHHCQQHRWNPNKFGGLIKNSLPSIINHYKGDVTKYANSNKILFDWQSRFYDHIVRNKNEFYRIKKYIKNNQKNWNKDKNNPNGIFM